MTESVVSLKGGKNLIYSTWVKKVNWKSAYKSSGSSGCSLSWFLYHEATRGISTPPCMGHQSIAGLPPALKMPVPRLERSTVRVKRLAQEYNTISLKPGLLNPESRPLTMRPPLGTTRLGKLSFSPPWGIYSCPLPCSFPLFFPQ